jgi:uncharacterized RDD family membrane protein YckC
LTRANERDPRSENFPMSTSAPSATTAARAGKTVVELAGLRRRLATLIYDAMLLVGVLAFAWLLPWAIILWALDMKESPVWVGVAESLHIFIVFGAYFIWYWHRHGQTLAMQTWRLKVVAVADGRNLSLRRACLRYVLAWPSVALCGVGLLWGVFDPERQFLHDRLAGTRVVVLPGVKKS